MLPDSIYEGSFDSYVLKHSDLSLLSYHIELNIFSFIETVLCKLFCLHQIWVEDQSNHTVQKN